MPLISLSDLQKLPDEPVQKWLHLRELLERRLEAVTEDRNGTDPAYLREYCYTLVSAAAEFGLGTFSSFSVANIHEDFPLIQSEVITLATKLSLRQPSRNIQNSVALPRKTKAKIFTQIERLRAMVTEADISDNQRKKLFAKLDEFHSLVVAPRTDFARLMIVVAAVATFVGETTGFVADAPVAIANMRAWIDEAIEDEQEEQRLLNEEQKPLQLADQRPRSDLDDEMPF
jgi:hypothetical protein